MPVIKYGKYTKYLLPVTVHLLSAKAQDYEHEFDPVHFIW